MSSSPPLNGPAAGVPALAVQQAVQRALAACQRGDLREAQQLCRRVLDAQPSYFDALYLLAIIEGRSGNAQQAVELLSKAVATNPGSADAHFNRGVALGELKRYEEAVASYDRAIALRKDYADAHYNRGVALGALDRHAEALDAYSHAIELRRDFAEAHNNHGFALSRLGRPAEAVTSYERAIALRPQYASAYNNRGNALADLDRRADALASFERAIALKPDYAEACNNRGIVLNDLERRDEALASFDRAIALNADYAEAFYNRGNTLRDMHRHRDAADSYRRAISIRPHYASAHWNLADCHLMLGDFAHGWREYEWRSKLPDGDNARRFPQPLWLGDAPLPSRTVLLHSERGLGDTLLFCRYAKEVAGLGATVVLEVQPPLLRLLAGFEGVAEIVATGDPLPPFDYHCPLMSLPLAFKTDLDTVPASVPYVRSDPASLAKWQAALGPKRRPRIGLVWSGSMALRNDKRSMALADLLPLARDWAEWVSLQKELNDADASLLAAHPEIRHFGGELTDFAETAALVDLMDVIVTVDTSVANLAGAMGKPVWVMLPFNPHDWRWMLEREDSIWYPTARLFRQPSEHDWGSVIRRVDDALVREFAIGG
jgi:tetratricopeptide (TPR) repeat protein